MRKLLKSKHGFTLVELMIVVIILGILVAIAVPIYGSVTKNAKKKACLSNKKILTSAAVQYFLTDTTDNFDGLFGGDSITSLDLAQQSNLDALKTRAPGFFKLFDGGKMPTCNNGENTYTVTRLGHEDRDIRVVCSNPEHNT